jgi:hypothetical protein
MLREEQMRRMAYQLDIYMLLDLVDCTDTRTANWQCYLTEVFFNNTFGVYANVNHSTDTV